MLKYTRRAVRHVNIKKGRVKPRSRANFSNAHATKVPQVRSASAEWAETRRGEADEFKHIFNKMLPILTDYIEQHTDKSIPITQDYSPEQIQDGLQVGVGAGHGSVDGFIEDVGRIMKYSVRTGKAGYMDKLYTGSEPVGQFSELLTGILNTNVHVFHSAPALSVIEVECVKTMGKLMGYADNCDGIFVPGGSYSNLLSVLMARQRSFPDVRLEGFQADDKPVILTSEHDHYSISRAAAVSGVGMNNMVKIPCNMQGQMDTDVLEETILKLKDEGRKPFYLCALAGTTVLGGFDKFPELARICKEHGIWSHIDGCWGGSVIMSETHRKLMDGAGEFDSIAWNPHKMLGVPLQCSSLLVKEPGMLQETCATNAEYLFHSGEFKYDLGKKTLQCGRKPDSVKFWLALKFHGIEGFGSRVDYAFENVSRMVHKIKESDGRFQLVAEPTSLNVCFWHVPKALRGILDLTNPEHWEKLHQHTATTHTVASAKGHLAIDFSPLPMCNLPNFFRLIIASHRVTEDELDTILAEIDSVGV